jgi:polyhydroxyalkanoate synthesis regulator protein
MCRYEQGITLAGVLYFHRISDPKMGGTSTRNFKMFRKLCGDTTLRNVIIVTNRWGEVSTQVGEAREAELIREDDFFKPVLDKGARMARHENTIPSAEKIIRLILKNNPLPLQIQMELVKEGKDISETSAGEELTRELNAQIKKYKEEVRTLREEMKQAIKDKEGEIRGELEIEMQKMREVIARLENDATGLTSNYEREKEMLEARLTIVEEGIRQEAEKYQQEIDGLKETLKGLESNPTASEKDKAKIQGQIDDLTKKLARLNRFFARAGVFLDDINPFPGIYNRIYDRISSYFKAAAPPSPSSSLPGT